ncbi:unnamed protein product [Brassica oleracea var. botrytis]
MRKKRKSERKIRKKKGKLTTTLDDFLPSSSSIPCCVKDQKVRYPG